MNDKWFPRSGPHKTCFSFKCSGNPANMWIWLPVVIGFFILPRYVRVGMLLYVYTTMIGITDLKKKYIYMLATSWICWLLFMVSLYPFHIKPIMRSQRRFENNAVWCERSEAALFDTGVRKGAFYVGGLLLPREVFWKRILAKRRSLRRCGCQCERVHRIMRRERPNNALGWWCPSALSCSVF